MDAALGSFVGQHNNRVAKTQFGMADPAVRLRKTHHLRGAEGFFVEIDSLRGSAHVQIGLNAVVALGNRFHGSHGSLRKAGTIVARFLRAEN
jgi:hypothetical protein